MQKVAFASIPVKNPGRSFPDIVNRLPNDTHKSVQQKD